MKKYNISIEQAATWGGAVFFVLLAVVLLAVFRVGMPAPVAQIEEADATLVAQRLEEILAGGTPQAAPPAGAPQGALAPGATATPACAGATLTIGEQVFRVDHIVRPSGSVQIPAEPADAAYWMEGSDDAPVFFLAPTVENLELANGLQEGDTLQVTWETCSTSVYTLHPARQQTLDGSLLDGTTGGVTVIVKDPASDNAQVLSSEYSGEEFLFLAPPAPDELLAEIGLLDVTSSADGKTIQVRVSIYNAGQTAFTLTKDDVALLVEGQAPAAPLLSEPALPRNLVPGQGEEIMFTFVKPVTPAAVIRVLTVEIDLEGY